MHARQAADEDRGEPRSRSPRHSAPRRPHAAPDLLDHLPPAARTDRARLDLEVVRALVRGTRREPLRTDALTDQERAVLRLMRQQLPYKEIAAHLGLSWHTVRSHAQSVLTKLGVHSRRDLRAWDARFE